MRAHIRNVLEGLLATTKAGDRVSLDDVGNALGTLHVTPDEIGLLIDELEASGRVVDSPTHTDTKALLGRVLASARVLKTSLGRAPTEREIAEVAGLEPEQVRRALFLGKVMGR